MTLTVPIVAAPARTAGIRLGHLADALLSGLAAARAALRTRRDQRALEELDDHILADLGIDRHRIDAAVRLGRRGGGEPSEPARRPEPQLPSSWTEWR